MNDLSKLSLGEFATHAKYVADTAHADGTAWKDRRLPECAVVIHEYARRFAVLTARITELEEDCSREHEMWMTIASERDFAQSKLLVQQEEINSLVLKLRHVLRADDVDREMGYPLNGTSALHAALVGVDQFLQETGR